MNQDPNSQTLKIASWNVNGLRSYIVDDLASTQAPKVKTQVHSESNLGHLIQLYDPDWICFQETRCGADSLAKFTLSDWKVYSSSSQGEGGRGPNRYSGVSIWVKNRPDHSISEALGTPEVLTQLPTLTPPFQSGDLEGRFIALVYPQLTIINTYVPNSGTNYQYRTERWDPAMLAFLVSERAKGKMTVWVGDLNVAHTPYDVHFGDVRHTPKGIKLKKQQLEGSPEYQTVLVQLTEEMHQTPAMRGIGDQAPAGFTRAERDGFQCFLDAGYIDSWRHLHPLTEQAYQGFTWWNLRIPAYRPSDRGWRIDYVLVDRDHLDSLLDCRVLPEVGTKSFTREKPKKYGSDHAPICATFRWPGDLTLPSLE